MTAQRRLRQSFRMLVPAVVAALALAGCGGGQPASPAASAPPAAPVTPEWQKVIDAAKAEGTVTLYSTQGTDQLKAFGQAFEDTYGVKVEVLRDIDANLAAKVDAERASNNPVADVVVTANANYVAQKGAEGWWTAPTGPDFQVPAFDAAEHLAADGSFVSGAAVFALGWNTQTLPGGLTSYQDLLKPELAGKIGVIDPSISPSVVDFYDFVERQTSPQFLDQLAAQRPQIFNSVLTAAQAVTSGQISAALAVQPLTDEKEQGAPVDSLVPTPAWGAPYRTVVLANAPHPNAAQLLADFMISPQGQAAVIRKQASVLPDVSGAATSIADVDVYEPADLTPAGVEQFRADFRAKFQ